MPYEPKKSKQRPYDTLSDKKQTMRRRCHLSAPLSLSNQRLVKCMATDCPQNPTLSRSHSMLSARIETKLVNRGERPRFAKIYSMLHDHHVNVTTFSPT